MMKGFGLAAFAAAIVAIAGPANAGQLATTVSADGDFGGSLSYLNDGDIPPLGQFYELNSVHNFGETAFTFDFGGAVTITDLLASVDNNDDYIINFFNGATLVSTFSIFAGDGPVPGSPGGMDTFASYAASGVTQLGSSFLITATSAVIAGANGDFPRYGIGEVQFFDNSVPEPASWAMMIGGFALVGGAMRRRVAALRFA